MYIYMSAKEKDQEWQAKLTQTGIIIYIFSFVSSKEQRKATNRHERVHSRIYVNFQKKLDKRNLRLAQDNHNDSYSS